MTTEVSMLGEARRRRSTSKAVEPGILMSSRSWRAQALLEEQLEGLLAGAATRIVW